MFYLLKEFESLKEIMFYTIAPRFKGHLCTVEYLAFCNYSSIFAEMIIINVKEFKFFIKFLQYWHKK